MKLKLSEQALANIHPTGKKKRYGKRTFLDVLNREVSEGEIVSVADGETAAAYVASGLMEPADAESARGVAAAVEKQRAPHQAAAEKFKAELEDPNADLPDDRIAYLERKLESEKGYCAAFDATLGRIVPKKAAEKLQAKEN